MIDLRHLVIDDNFVISMRMEVDCLLSRAVGRFENPGVPVLFGGHNLSPLVEIGLTGLSKSGGAMATLAPPERQICYVKVRICQ